MSALGLEVRHCYSWPGVDVGVRFLIDVNVTIKQSYIFRIVITKKIGFLIFYGDNIYRFSIELQILEIKCQLLVSAASRNKPSCVSFDFNLMFLARLDDRV
jgi:hypothetical protein